MRINSPKTGERMCPIFPELQPFLLEAYEAAPDGATRCITRYTMQREPWHANESNHRKGGREAMGQDLSESACHTPYRVGGTMPESRHQCVARSLGDDGREATTCK